MDFFINKVIEIKITKTAGSEELISGLKSKLNAIAPPIRDNISKERASATPKNIFLPKVASLEDPKINNIAINIIAIREIGFTNLLYNSTSKIPDLNLLSDKN